MIEASGETLFAGSIPDIYERLMVPLIFEPYALDLAARTAAVGVGSVLEIAAGTGVLTRHMADRLPATTAIVATDLNQPMLDHAASVGTSRPVTWQQADVMALPFDDASFDTVVCQFGVMFFPDRVAAYREVLRVLRPGGTFLFNTWDRIETNEFADVAGTGIATIFPDDPPMFMALVPHGYHDEALIRADLAAAGFGAAARFDTVAARSRAATCEIPAIAFCQGTPLRNAIEARDPGLLAAATTAAATALRDRFGATDLDGGIRGFVISVQTA